MKKFRQMPSHAVPKEWAPDEEKPRYANPLILIRKFNALSHANAQVKFVALLAIVESIPMPMPVRWVIATLVGGAYLGLQLKIRGVQREARKIEELDPPKMSVRDEESEEPKDEPVFVVKQEQRA